MTNNKKHGREADKEAPKLHMVGRTGKLLRDFGFCTFVKPGSTLLSEKKIQKEKGNHNKINDKKGPKKQNKMVLNLDWKEVKGTLNTIHIQHKITLSATYTEDSLRP